MPETGRRVNRHRGIQIYNYACACVVILDFRRVYITYTYMYVPYTILYAYTLGVGVYTRVW